MPNTTNFDHDSLAHLLQDRKLSIPDFQREYSWTEDNIEDYWNDITRAIDDGDSYFLGTVVLADVDQPSGRQYIVDGQQRIVTTALTMYAISRAAGKLGKDKAQEKIFADFIADYDLDQEEVLPKLQLSAHDQKFYSRIIEGTPLEELQRELKTTRQASALVSAFAFLTQKVEEYQADTDPYKMLVTLKNFLANDAQVLLAVASGLSEAYVIFETLNDRGAALTTADLLKNFFLSTVGEARVQHALHVWTSIAARFDKPDSLVSFIKTDYTSRWGQVKKKDLYKELQGKLGRNGKATYDYLLKLYDSLDTYEALYSFDSSYWSSISTDVRDEIIAHRRFRIETPNAMFLAALRNWRPKEATTLIKIATSWSIRAALSGLMGGGTAERIYGDVAAKIEESELKTASEVEKWFLDRDFVPSDSQFRGALLAVKDNNLTRIKYLLAKLELAYWEEVGKDIESFPAWETKTISVEHITAKSKAIAVKDNGEGSLLKEHQHSLPNLTLLERSANNSADNAEFNEKVDVYGKSAFELTRQLANLTAFTDQEIDERKKLLLDLSLRAWPLKAK